MVWVPVHSAWNHKAVISPWMGQGIQNAECKLKEIEFRSPQSEFRNREADASGAFWPGPQTNDRIFSGEEGRLLPARH